MYNFFYKKVTPCHGFPLERLKNIPVWDCLECHCILFINLSCHGLGMACHDMSSHGHHTFIKYDSY